MKKLLWQVILFTLPAMIMPCQAQQKNTRFKALVLYENGGHHIQYSAAARIWLDQLAADSGFSITYINNTDLIDDDFLRSYQLFIQLDYPPYNWKENAVVAFQHYIEQGRGGWLGFHHATLLGKFDGYPMWQWFSDFMGGIEFKNYIPGFADGKVTIEDATHPCMKNLPPEFTIEKEEWYTYNISPRANVKVIAGVDESSYTPASEIKMGDHPVVWTNTNYAAKNIYIFMGHSPELFKNKYYTTLFKNALFWSAVK